MRVVFSCGCRGMAQRARSRCQFLAARPHGVLHWHHYISTVCVDLSSSPEFRENVYESCSAIQCVLMFCSVNNCLPSNTTNQTNGLTRVYEGIPTRDSTRECKVQMQECTTRRLCQQTEIMLECEDAVMMLSNNLSTLCLCKAVCKVRTHIWKRRMRQGAAGRPGIDSVIAVLVLDS